MYVKPSLGWVFHVLLSKSSFKLNNLKPYISGSSKCHKFNIVPNPFPPILRTNNNSKNMLSTIFFKNIDTTPKELIVTLKHKYEYKTKKSCRVTWKSGKKHKYEYETRHKSCRVSRKLGKKHKYEYETRHKSCRVSRKLGIWNTYCNDRLWQLVIYRCCNWWVQVCYLYL